jgi:phage-related protein
MSPVLPGVFELRDQDEDFWYRVLYKEIEGAIYILHCFRKKTNETPRRDIHSASLRLKNVRQRLAECKR